MIQTAAHVLMYTAGAIGVAVLIDTLRQVWRELGE